MKKSGGSNRNGNEREKGRAETVAVREESHPTFIDVATSLIYTQIVV